VISFRVFLNLSHSQIENKIEIYLSESDSHHASSVLRLSAGDTLTIVDKTTAREFKAAISPSVHQKGQPLSVIITEEIITEEIIKDRGSSRIGSISFALCKGKKNDIIVEKATELGAENIILWQSERSIVRLGAPSELESKKRRWLTIAESAAKQCKRVTLPEILVTSGHTGVLKAIQSICKKDDLLLMFSLSKDPVHPSSILKPTGQSHLIIGPEGDLTPEEEAHFKSFGFMPVTLGPNILRSETAAIAAMGLMHGLWP